MERKLDRRRGVAELRLLRPDRFAWRGAAYALTGGAYVALGRRGETDTAQLRPKGGGALSRLADAFEREYSEQLRFWITARAGRAARAEILRRALALADSVGAGRGPVRASGLSQSQAREIADLLSEAEGAPRDPLGIAVPWEERRRP